MQCTQAQLHINAQHIVDTTHECANHERVHTSMHDALVSLHTNATQLRVLLHNAYCNALHADEQCVTPFASLKQMLNVNRFF